MKTSSNGRNWRPDPFSRERNSRLRRSLRVACGLTFILAATAATNFLCSFAHAQQNEPAKQAVVQQNEPAVVQPGAPGKPGRRLPPSTTAKLPPASPAEAEFMRGMIIHHAQAVEMTALISSHTENKDVGSLGARISRSQSDEIRFMKRWLASRGQEISPAMPEMPGMNMSRGEMSHGASHG